MFKLSPVYLSRREVFPSTYLYLCCKVNRFFMKLFTSSDMQTTEFCRLQFSFKLPSEQTAHRCKKCASSEFVNMNLVNFSFV